jgi:hypothetical protein
MSDINKTELKKTLKEKDFRDIINEIIKDYLKNNKKFDDQIKEINKETMGQFFKTMWQKRDFWKNNV